VFGISIGNNAHLNISHLLSRIKACATSNGNSEQNAKALQIAASAFNSIGSAGLKADSATYTSMARAILNLSASSGDKVNALSGIFQRCCEDGCLNQHIVDTLVDETSKEEFAMITGSMGYEHGIQIENLPTKWSCNSTRGF
jgi:hypothetical protein